MKAFFQAIGVAAVLWAAAAGAGSLYSWSSGETLSASQLNTNFSHIHNNMVGGHGARLVDADVSASAAISRSKLQNYQGLPTGFAKVGSGTTACSTGTCTLGDSHNVTSVTFNSTGNYTVTIPTMGDSEFGAVAAAHAQNLHCGAAPASATTATVICTDLANTLANAVFTVTFFDNN